MSEQIPQVSLSKTLFWSKCLIAFWGVILILQIGVIWQSQDKSFGVIGLIGCAGILALLYRYFRACQETARAEDEEGREAAWAKAVHAQLNLLRLYTIAATVLMILFAIVVLGLISRIPGWWQMLQQAA